MAKTLVSINGINIGRQPTKFGFERYKITKSGRTIDGNMTAQIVAKKRKWTFTWAVLNGTQMERIFAAVDEEFFFKLVFIENGVTNTFTVYAGAVKYEQFRSDGVWYWKDVGFDLIQQ